MEFQQCISFLEKRFKEPLPGKSAQYLMAPQTRLSNDEYLEKFPEHRISSVLILLYPSSEKINFVLIERAGGGGVHGGQIALPGGKHELADRNLQNTALRETEEEIGVERKKIILLGTLTDLFIPASKFRVHPYVGFVNNKPEFAPHTLEVKKIIEADLEFFLDDKIKFKKEFTTVYGKLPAPYFKLENHEIWGATAMIISEFISLFNSSNTELQIPN